MNINLTLLIQIVHFFIAYYLLSNFLLKPILSFLKDDIDHRANLRTSAQKEKEKLLLKEEHKKNQWLKCQEYFATHKPKIDFSKIESKLYPGSVKPVEKLTKSEIDKLSNSLVKVLKSKVVHG